jgi:hypothetical protein
MRGRVGPAGRATHVAWSGKSIAGPRVRGFNRGVALLFPFYFLFCFLFPNFKFKFKFDPKF